MRVSRVLVVAFIALLPALGLASARAQDGGDEPAGDLEATVETTDGAGTTTVSAASAGVALCDSGRPRLAVYPFENPPEYYNSAIGNGLTGMIVAQLAESGRFNVIRHGESPEPAIDDIIPGRFSSLRPDMAIEMGRSLGVDYILLGRVADFWHEETDIGGFTRAAGGFGNLDSEKDKAVVRLDFSLVDVATGTTVLAASEEGKERETGASVSGARWDDWVRGGISFDSEEFKDSMIGHAAIKAVDNLVKRVLELFPIQGFVLAVAPTFVVVDVGSTAGLEEGMEFEVYRVSAVTNAAGEMVWENRTLVGRVRVTEVQPESSKAEIISGSDFMEGDICIKHEEEEEG